MEQVNCWEYHRCTIYGYCPANPDHGNECWKIEGTLCSGRPQPAHSGNCVHSCTFFKEVHISESSDQRWGL